MHAFACGLEAYLQRYLLLIYRLGSAFLVLMLGFQFILFASLLYSVVRVRCRRKKVLYLIC